MMNAAASKGELDVRIDTGKYKGDFGKITNGINDTMNVTVGVLRDIGSNLDRISNGDFTAQVTAAMNGDYLILKSATNTLGIGSTYTINRATTNGTVTFTVNGRRSDTGAAISGTTTSIAFQWRNYVAASSTVPTDNATAQTVVNASVTSALDTDRAWTATCTAANDTVGNFTYVIYPASYGNLSNIIQNGALSVLSAFTNLGDFTVTNAYAASISVRIYKSNSDKAFASGTTLAIS
jgi:hypothetical protein